MLELDFLSDSKVLFGIFFGEWKAQVKSYTVDLTKVG